MQPGSSAIIWPSITRHLLAWRHRRHSSSPLLVSARSESGSSKNSACWTSFPADGSIWASAMPHTPYELRYYGVDPGGTRAIFNEALTVLISGLTNSRLTFEGEYYQYSDVPMELRSFQKPYPPLWYPTHNPESVQYAARHGLNFVGLGPAASVREHVDAYWQTWELHRHDSGRLNGHVAAPKVGILRQVFVADTDDEDGHAA